jgi:hypothetical protein
LTKTISLILNNEFEENNLLFEVKLNKIITLFTYFKDIDVDERGELIKDG